jgi:hypothetical protein
MVSFPEAESGSYAALILLSLCGRERASATEAPHRRNLEKSLSDLPKGESWLKDFVSPIVLLKKRCKTASC